MVKFHEPKFYFHPHPKKIGANRIQEFRPISLTSALYKIIAKVLSNRIRDVLHEVIDGNQYAFIKERQILDSISTQMSVRRTIKEEILKGL